MSLNIRMLGTGQAFAKTYFNNNALVTCNGYTLLIDFGITGPLAMHQMNVPLDAVDGVLLTHLHADHAGGVEELALRLKYQYNKKPALFIEERLVEPLWHHSLKAGLEFGSAGPQQLDDFFELIPLRAIVPHLICPGFSMELLPTRHFPNMPSYAAIFNNLLFYSGDTIFDRELIDTALKRGCKHLLHDCQLDGHGLVHATLEELMTLPPAIQRMIRLMHYGDHMEQFIGHTGHMSFLRQHETYTFQ